MIEHVNVTYGGTVSTAFFADLSNGQYTSVPFWTPDYDNTSAEYIWEDVDGMDAPNTSGTFRGCAALGPNGNLPLYYANYREFIVTSDGTSTGVPWAWPTSIPNSDSGFTIESLQSSFDYFVYIIRWFLETLWIGRNCAMD